MTRRNSRSLQQAIADATTPAARARAYYELGLFHDNNSREAAAVPSYEAALALGLDDQTEAYCLAWLASSLLKTSRPVEATQRAAEAAKLASEPELLRFIEGLQRRIKRTLR